jgi:hypothetical protein
MDALVVTPDDALLTQLELTRGIMHPVNHDQWTAVHDQVQTLGVKLDSGGSCANTIATIGRLGAKSVYCGQVGDDTLGRTYAGLVEQACGAHALRFSQEHATGKCLSIISQDAERTMVTDLGASIQVSDFGDFRQHFESTRYAHFTGYTLLDSPMRPVALQAMQTAKDANALISLDVADPFVIATTRDLIWKAIEDFADIVFLNADEARALTGEEPEDALNTIAQRAQVQTVVVKLGSRGSLVRHQGEVHRVAVKPTHAVDTTGAGDAYAGGFLYGLAQGWSIPRAGQLGSAVAALTVGQIGAVTKDPEALQAALAACTAS